MGPTQEFTFLKNSQLMMKLLAFRPHFDWPALYPQALAGFQELITSAEVDKDGFHHMCCLPSLFPGAAGVGGWMERMQLWFSIKLLLYHEPPLSACRVFCSHSLRGLKTLFISPFVVVSLPSKLVAELRLGVISAVHSSSSSPRSPHSAYYFCLCLPFPFPHLPIVWGDA